MNARERIETEILRRVYLGSNCVEIGEDSDCPGLLELRTMGSENKEYFGVVNLTAMTPEFARHLGLALCAAANEQEAKETK